jgi:hypothetical protein
MKGNGRVIKKMGKASIAILMALTIKDYSKMDIDMDRAFFIIIHNRNK